MATVSSRLVDGRPCACSTPLRRCLATRSGLTDGVQRPLRCYVVGAPIQVMGCFGEFKADVFDVWSSRCSSWCSTSSTRSRSCLRHRPLVLPRGPRALRLPRFHGALLSSSTEASVCFIGDFVTFGWSGGALRPLPHTDGETLRGHRMVFILARDFFEESLVVVGGLRLCGLGWSTVHLLLHRKPRYIVLLASISVQGVPGFHALLVGFVVLDFYRTPVEVHGWVVQRPLGTCSFLDVEFGFMLLYAICRLAVCR